MRNVSQSVCLRCLPVPDPFDGALFCTFQPVSELVIWSFISKSDFKTCKLDWLLPLFLWNTLILSFLLSLLSSTLPCPLAPFLTVLKLPLLHLFKNTPKNPTLDRNKMKNYSPVSNLLFASNVIEKLVVSRLSEHLSKNNLYSHFQSTYRCGHSNETALLKIVNDLLSLDDDNVSLLFWTCQLLWIQ